jgi:hypothetical protein
METSDLRQLNRLATRAMSSLLALPSMGAALICASHPPSADCSNVLKRELGLTFTWIVIVGVAISSKAANRSPYGWDDVTRGGLGRLTNREQTANTGKMIAVSAKGAFTNAEAMIAQAQRMAFAMKCFRYMATSSYANCDGSGRIGRICRRKKQPVHLKVSAALLGLPQASVSPPEHARVSKARMRSGG